MIGTSADQNMGVHVACCEETVISRPEQVGVGCTRVVQRQYDGAVVEAPAIDGGAFGQV